MFDINKTPQLIKGGLLEPTETWQKYLEGEHDWKETAVVLTVPLITVSVLLSAIFAWLFSAYSMFGMQSGIVATLKQLITAFAGISIASFIFSYLAGVFKGQHDFNKAFAALSLAAIPGMIGRIFAPTPMIGLLISLILSIIGLVYLYKIIPSYLQVEQSKRVVHFIVSLIASFLIMVVLSMILGLNMMASSNQNSFFSKNKTNNNHMLGRIGQQVELIEQAKKDTFSPPSNGKISKHQMETLYTTLTKAQVYQASQTERLKELKSQMKDKKDFSFADLAKVTSRMGSALSGANAEMEVVKSSGGNWAEYNWVKNQLHVALIQKDINAAVKHNYALYQDYADKLKSKGYIP